MAEVWKQTLEELRKDPSYRGMFYMMQKFEKNVAGEITDKDDKIIRRTYADYIRLSKQACGNLQKEIGKETGRMVGLLYETTMDWPVLLWGILMSGNIPLLLSPYSDEVLNDNILTEADASYYVAARPMKNGSHKWVDASYLLRRGAPGEEFWGEYVALCTSGTSGTSRIFLYDAKTIAAHMLSFDEAKQKNVDMPFDENKPTKLLAFLPFHHVFGFSVVYLLYSVTGKTLVYLRDKAVSTILAACKDHRVTNVYCVPMFFNALATGISKKVDASKKVIWPFNKIIQGKILGTRIRLMIVGGGHCPEETLKVINNIGYPLCNGFGMTESGIISVETSTDPEQRKKGSIGTPFSSTEYKLMPEGGDRGELYIRGDALYTASIVDKKIVFRDKSKWFATGDIVRKTPDGLYIDGRAKDVIINASGENVYPDEIEDYFKELPVKKICILGIKDGNYEEITLIAEVDKLNFDSTEMTRMVSEVNDKLPVHQKVTRVLVSNDPLPLSGSLKVKRQLLKRAIEENTWDYQNLSLYKATREETVKKPVISDQVKYDEIEKYIRHSVAQTLDIEEKTLDSKAHFILELGGDSLSVFSIITDIQDRYNLVISDDEMMTLSNIKDMTNYVYSKLVVDNKGSLDDEEQKEEGIDIV